ncbi:MAG: histidine--tRNA ligase [Phycisphaerales bacterium]|nr:MAG: histidine--tRNA ligase [Phycisphaerales bacterium]
MSLHSLPMAGNTHKFQAPKGTRDFYPPAMAVRRYIESVWREVSINHGFEEIDGPTFEHLELYTAKSGPGIVSELFSFRREGGDADYALRPEFTPTLARMYASAAQTLPKPVKWFCIPNFFRAERPQRGRLREFFQWNADIIGDDSPSADAEVIAVTVGVLEKFGFTPDQVKVKISHRDVVRDLLMHLGIKEQDLQTTFELIDRRDKIPDHEFEASLGQLGLSIDRIYDIKRLSGAPFEIGEEYQIAEYFEGVPKSGIESLERLGSELRDRGLRPWCHYNFSIVRGLAYYTGTVFEVIAEGERSVAGGGRYDKLVELVGGPLTPAVGIAMGDVVLRLILEDRGLLGETEEYLPRPDVFVISALDDDGGQMRKLVADLRRSGLHARHSYRATKNVGKLLGEAGKVRARFAVILGKELEDGAVALKDLESGDQREVKVELLVQTLKDALGK